MIAVKSFDAISYDELMDVNGGLSDDAKQALSDLGNGLMSDASVAMAAGTLIGCIPTGVTQAIGGGVAAGGAFVYIVGWICSYYGSN